MTLGLWNYVKPYLLCYNSDQYTEGVALFLKGSSNTFTVVQQGGGTYSASYLQDLGVPPATANKLVSGLHP
jgi:hypothetical protein